MSRTPLSARRPARVTCAAATSTRRGWSGSSPSSPRSRSRSSARRPIAAPSRNAPSSGRSGARSGRPRSTSSRRRRRRTPPCRTPSGCAGSASLREWLDARPSRGGAGAPRRRGRARSCSSSTATRSPGATWWGTPGGGVEPGEDHELALRRELARSSGLHEFEPGPARLGALAHVPVGAPAAAPDEQRLPGARRRPRAARRRSISRRRASPTYRWWTLDELERTSERLAPTCPTSCCAGPYDPERRDRRPRRRPPARRDRLGRRLDGAGLRRRAGDPHARGRAARPSDEGARAALAPARLRRAARRGADGRRPSPRATGSERSPFQIVFWVKVALAVVPRGRLVPAQLRPRPSAAGGDPGGARAERRARRSSSSAGSATA